MSTPEARSGYDTIRERALELFVSKGFGQVSMRELARHVGIAPGSLYNHFPSKQALLFDLIEEFYEELHLLVQQPVQRRRTAAPRPLSKLIVDHLRLHRERPLHFRLALQGFAYLDTAQKQRIILKRVRYERAFLHAVFSDAFSAHEIGTAAGHVITRFLNCLPGWLEERPLTDEAYTHLVERLIRGAVQECSAQ
ncbi:DNA-binding transcriptional regulator, AcrR family [Pseudomonas sp. 43mfcvi1.1]|jgi:AcrR family transcriptional regulator|uniref:TetR/AcrR family transcriptional regulator n=1 Tax=unclassified Pseudomonas TaxID=196821 RepID=UPI000D6C2BC6|nr:MULTISPECIES: TetR/AcrR family transcriptional regulator [unclassified Pseudomonas]PWJ39024.1 TetR family transcriptional regulator [Pseudomonas sp. 43mfcvi1.1]BBH34071.1 transcriptional regulator [Pseudomonas sp. St290]SSB96288.1 DNA-binding transcriptional regulator, AcrR family [Pseudomonas sp. 43mfcvi1.1]